MKTVTIILLLFLMTCSVLTQSVKYELNCDYQLLWRMDQISKGFMGLREKTGRNDGYWIDRFNKSVNSPRYSSYCNAGPYFCWDSAKRVLKTYDQIPVPKSGLANSTFNYALKYGKKVPLKPNKFDYLIWRVWKNGKATMFGHVEQVDSVLSRNLVRTKAYNTSFGKGTAQNGNGCGYKMRYLNHPLGQLKIRGLVGFNYGKGN